MDETQMTEGSELILSEEQMEQALEAILFAAGHPVSYDKIAEVLGISVNDVKSMAEVMSMQYESRGIQLLLFPDSCQLSTKEIFATQVRDALGIRRGGNLSGSSMEVLAVVAYNQPVTRSFIDNVRGVDSSYAVSSLLDKELIEAAGRLDAPGRPMLYATTDKFLRVFGLRSLSELPETEALSTAAAQMTIDKELLTTSSEDSPADYEAPKDSEETDVILDAGVTPED